MVPGPTLHVDEEVDGQLAVSIDADSISSTAKKAFLCVVLIIISIKSFIVLFFLLLISDLSLCTLWQKKLGERFIASCLVAWKITSWVYAVLHLPLKAGAHSFGMMSQASRLRREQEMRFSMQDNLYKYHGATGGNLQFKTKLWSNCSSWKRLQLTVHISIWITLCCTELKKTPVTPAISQDEKLRLLLYAPRSVVDKINKIGIVNFCKKKRKDYFYKKKCQCLMSKSHIFKSRRKIYMI